MADISDGRVDRGFLLVLNYLAELNGIPSRGILGRGIETVRRRMRTTHFIRFAGWPVESRARVLVEKIVGLRDKEVLLVEMDGTVVRRIEFRT